MTQGFKLQTKDPKTKTATAGEWIFKHLTTLTPYTTSPSISLLQTETPNAKNSIPTSTVTIQVA